MPPQIMTTPSHDKAGAPAGYTALLEDVTMARYSPFLNAMTLDAIELLNALTWAVA